MKKMSVMAQKLLDAKTKKLNEQCIKAEIDLRKQYSGKISETELQQLINAAVAEIMAQR